MRMFLFRRADMPKKSAVQQLLDTFLVVGRHLGAAVEAPGALGRLVLEQVATVGLLAHDLSGAGDPEPFRSAAVGLRLWHWCPLVLCCIGLRYVWVVGWGRRGRRGGFCSPGRRCVGVVRRLGASLRAAVRCQHHRHVAAVLLGRRLDEAVVGDVGAQPLQQPVAQLGPRLLASAEHDGHLDLRPRLEEADDVTLLGLVIVWVDLGSQFLFLDDCLLLVLARLARLLSRLVLELAVVHDLANRRFGVWGYFDEVEICIRGDAQCVFDAHNAYLLTAWSDQADFGYADALVDAGLSADGASYVVLSETTPSALCSIEQRGPAQSRAQSRPGQASDACDRTAAPVRRAVGVGLHLLSLTYAGTVAHASLAGMTDDPAHDVGAASPPVRDMAEIPAVEVITRSAVMLMSAAAEKLGLSAQDPDESQDRDLDEARRLTTALAGFVRASVEYLGPHAGPVRDGLKTLQLAFREASAAPEEPGQGPGEKYTGPVW